MKLCMGCMSQIEDHLSTCPYCGFNEITLRQESYYLDPGTVVGGKYIVGRVLSYGGHTVSYLGMDAENQRKVIVKEYLPSDFSTRSEGEKEVTIYSGDGQAQFEQGLTNFLNEANRIQHLQGAEGIAEVYDCVAENETGYVISEYVEGRTLKEILDGGKKYSAEEAAAFIRKILQGLAGVHRMDIVHCDISPETIMVTNEGEIKLMDFGATRYVTTANSKSLSIILKRGYAPEEQYRSRGRRGPWTDVYAVGAVMYRMITGAVPQESVERALSDDLKEPSKMGVSISKDMENALMNALNVYQDDRTPSAEAFLKELNSAGVKRIRVKQKKNKTGKFPLWAKGLVAGLACLVAAGGAYVVIKNSGSGSGALGSEAVIMQDLKNKSYEDARAYIEDLNKKYGWDIRLDTENTVFDLTKDDGTVYAQSISPGEVLYDPAKESQEETSTEHPSANQDKLPEGWARDAEGKVTGTVSVTLSSTEKIHYSEIRGLNAYMLAQKLGIDTQQGGACFIAEEEGGTNYYDLLSLETADGTISNEELCSEENKEKEIAYQKDGIKIHYYATDFFYWESLPDFAKDYGTIDNVREQPQYRYSNEKKKEESKSRSLNDSGLIDDGYYTLSSSGHETGEIVGQTVEAGTEYDESNPGDTLLKLKVIGEVLEYEGKTGEKFAEELKNLGFGLYGFITSTGSEGQKEWNITDVTVYQGDGKGGHTDEELDCFGLDPDNPQNTQNIYFVITVEKPVQKSLNTGGGTGGSTGGGYTGGSTGGGYTGGGIGGTGGGGTNGGRKWDDNKSN